MPHIAVEHCEVVGETVDIAGLVACLHRAAIATGTFPDGAVRSFSCPVRFALAGDGTPGNGFVRVSVRIAPGRSAEAKTAVVAALYAAAEQFLQPAFDRGPMALQLELSEFNSALTRSRNTMLSPTPA
jgi:5-carboxymethyl-2-hydroxymuconate isomerase